MAINEAYSEHRYLLESKELTEGERKCFEELDNYAKNPGAKESVANDTICNAVKNLANCLYRYYGKKVIILLDEYDTPMQEAYLYGYWDQFTSFVRSLFNATFKTNPYLERAMMTGITRVSKESVFSDLNNLNVITSTSLEYETSFGFTEEEVFNVRSHGPLPSHWERIREPSSLQCSLYCRSFIHFINSSIFINMNRDVVRNDVCGSPVLLRKKGR